MKKCLFAALALLLGGCLFATEDNRRAGAEDFPNTIEALGKTAAAQVDVQGEWNEWDQIPKEVEGLGEFDSAFAPVDEALPAFLGKRSATRADTLRWDVSDTARGIVRRIRIHDGIGVQREEDTLTLRYDSAFKARDTAHLTVLSRRGQAQRAASLKAWRYSNTDSLGGLDKGVLRYVRTVGALQRMYQADVRIDTMPRRLLDTASEADDLTSLGGLAIVSYRYQRLRGGDTLESLDVVALDPDGGSGFEGIRKEGALFADDTCFIRLTHVTYEPALRPSVLRSIRKTRGLLVRVAAPGGRSWRVIPSFYLDERLERDGKIVTFRIRGRRGDSTFSSGDTVTIDKSVTLPDPSPLSMRSDAFTVALAPDFVDLADHRLINYVASWAWRSGPLVESRFVFKPAVPAAAQQLRSAGKISMTVKYRDGAEGDLDADLVSDKLAARYRETRLNKLRRFRVTWDVLGNVLEKAEDTSPAP